MKTAASFFLFILCLTSAAQTADDYYTETKPKIQMKYRVSGSVMAGTSVSFLNNSKTTAVSTFIAPKINFKVNQRFSVTAGMIHYTLAPGSSFGIRNNETLYNSRNRASSSDLLFAGGEYKLNKKMMVSGALMVEAGNTKNFQNNYKAVSLGMDYRISEHSSIGFRATVSQGNTDYMFDPKQGSYQYRPFNNNGFGNAFTGMGLWGTDELNRTIR